MKLTAENVHATIKACLPKSVTDKQREALQEGKEIDGIIPVKGVVGGFAFIKTKLEAKREDVRSMLADLPDDFHEDKGGGMSFLNACMTRDGEHWGEQPTVSELLCLGMGLGIAKILMPREMWDVLPGGVPYFSVKVA